MALKLLTDKQISNARKRSRDYLLADGEGLYFRVRHDRAPQWTFIYRLDGERKRRGLGVYPAIGLSAARALAAQCREQVARGLDPVEAERQSSTERKAARQRKAARHTVQMLFDEWKRRELSARRKDGGRQAGEYFERDVAGRIGDRFADEITRRDIQTIINEIAERGARRSANIVRALLRQMFGFALDQEIITADPTARVRKLEGADKERTRILSPAEIRELSEKLAVSGLAPRYQAAIFLMLSTCARIGELSLARWADVDLVAGTMKIPAANAKNGREHLIHLSDFALRHFASLSRVEGSDFLFTNTDGKSPIHPKTIPMQLYDWQRETPVKGRTAKAGTLALSGGRWTAHDLRRTGATLMGELGIHSDVIDRALNHTASKITRTYQRQELIPERREAFERLGDRLDAILKGEPGKVAMFHGKRPA